MFQIEIKVLFNSDPKSFIHFKNHYRESDFIQFSSIEQAQTPAAARNSLLKDSSDGWILFLDDDAAVKENYFLQFLEVIKNNPDLKVFGGPNLNFEGSSTSEQLQGLVLGSWWAAGPFSARYSSKPFHQTKKTSSLILCQLWIKKDSSEEILFSPDLVCAEENELFSRTYKSRNISFFYFPQLIVFHHRRSNIQDFFKQTIKFGKGRGQWLRMNSNSLITFLFLLSIGLIGSVFFFVWGALCGLFQAILKRNLNLFLPIWLYCASLQIGYLYGVVSGYYKHFPPLAKR